MPKLTKTFIDKAAPPAKGYAMYWDDVVKGYGLRVTAKGKKVFIAMGRVKGKAVCVTIGPYGLYTEELARNGLTNSSGEVIKQGARHILQAMRDGIDPRDAKKAEEAAKITLRQVADAYIGRPGKLKDSSKAEIDRHVTTTFEVWEHKPITNITEDDCRKRYREILTKGLRGNREGGSPGQANQAFSVLRALINYASRQYKTQDGKPLVLHNPVAVLKDDWVGLDPRDSSIPLPKVGAVWHMLTEARTNAYNRDTWSSIDLIMFLMLTGARKEEAASLTWDHVNLEESWWHIPDPKNRRPIWLPLSSQAVQLLTTRQRIEGNSHVFPSWGNTGHIKDPRGVMMKVSDVAGTKITPHDLRRTFADIGYAECSIDLAKIKQLLNHKPQGVTEKHYLKTSRLQYLLPEVQRIADWITEKGQSAAAIASGKNVVALRA